MLKVISRRSGLGIRPLDLGGLRREARLLHVSLELGPELLDHRADRHRHRVAEDAQAVADDPALDAREDVEVHRGRLAVLDALDHLHGPVRALAARRALAAGLVAVEL